MYKFHLNDPLFLPHCGCDISLSLNPGEMLTLIGKNGIGKTSLVHRFYLDHAAQMTLIDQSSLDIFFDRNLKKIKEIFLAAGKAHLNKDFFLKAWASFGLEAKEDRMQSSLSGGEGQVLKIALGLAPDSEIYILDEPSHYLDDTMRVVLNDLLQELLLQKKSIIMIEHDYSWVKSTMRLVELEQINGVLKVGKSWTT